MFSVKVEVTDKNKSHVSRAGSSSEIRPDDVALEFSVGNPHVEHVAGIVHLYRKDHLQDGTAQGSHQLCVLNVPPDIGVQEFCRLCGSYLSSIREIRFLRREHGRGDGYMVYLRFIDISAAEAFFEEYSGRPFCAFEEDVVWKLVAVDRLEFTDSPRPSLGETELPTCPVCLERLDESVSGVVVTVCNHVFHNVCLMQWEDTSCPVCRHCMQGTTRSCCARCGATEDLWICLICGHVGCGRYKSKCAVDHWKETQHCYALELESQRVWDYVGDGYVHRLVQSNPGGKLVEVVPPGECSARGSGGDVQKVDYDRDEAIVASKLDAVAFEYNHLLTAQLESQRLYFEGILYQNRLEMESRIRAMNESASENAKEAAETLDGVQGEARELTKQNKALAKKTVDLSQKATRVEEEKEFLRQLNETLISNQRQWKDKTAALEHKYTETVAAKDVKIKELEDQVRDLIVFIEAQKAVGEGDEMQGADVTVPREQPSENRNRRRRGRR